MLGIFYWLFLWNFKKASAISYDLAFKKAGTASVKGHRACFHIILGRIATPGTVFGLFLIHTLIRLFHHIHDMHVPFGPYLPKRQGFGVCFIGLASKRGELLMKNPFRNIPAEEDEFVAANAEKIVPPEIAAEYPADVPDVFVAGVVPLLIVDAL